MLKKLLSTDLNTFISEHYALLILRIGAGVLIFTHGFPKLLKVFAGDFSFSDPIGLGPALSLILVVFAEGICSIFIALGLGTRLAAFVLCINMAVIAFVAHAGDPFSSKEKGLLFLVMFAVIFFTGGGKYSLDQKIS